MSYRMSLEEYLEEEFKLLGVKPHITHLKQPAGCRYNYITVATSEYVAYIDLDLSLSFVYREGAEKKKSGSDLDRLIIAWFAYRGAGVSPCHAVDNFSRKRGRLISEGRLLKALRSGGLRR